MGRKRRSTVDKRKPVKVRMIQREHAGKVTEPYRIMEAMVKAHHDHLGMATIVMAWRDGWRPDTDGVLCYAKIKKASDLDKAIVGNDGIDFVIQLNAEVWGGLSEAKKTQIIDHELCHAEPDRDANGEQKMDDQDRLCWRLRKHPIQEFDEIIKRYGIKEVLNLNAELLDAKDKATRPLLREADAKDDVESVTFAAGARSVTLGKQPDSNGKSGTEWRSLGLCAAAFSASDEALLEKAEVTTLGQLQDLIDQKATIRGVNGNYRTRIEAKLAKYRQEVTAE